MSAPQRRLSDLCAYYKLVPGAKDVYVEGVTDQRIWNAEFADAGLMDVVAYPVSAIDIDTADRTQIPHSCKDRLLLVAEYLAQCNPTVESQVVCLVDADDDHYNGVSRSNPLVIETELADLLCYFFKADALKYSLVHVFGNRVDIADCVERLVTVGASLFCARQALLRIDRSIGFLEDPGEACTVPRTGPPRLELSQDKLLNKTLGPAKRMDLKPQLAALLKEILPRQDLEPLQQVNGHDLVDLLRKLLVKRGRERFSGATTVEQVEAMLYGTQRAVRLNSTETFKAISTRFGH